jgi:adenine-specific DNA-methyltransferase
MPPFRLNSTPKKTAAKKPLATKKPSPKSGSGKRPSSTIAKAAASLRRAKKVAAVPEGSAMAMRRGTPAAARARAVKQYEHHTKKRLNNPPVGLVTPETDPDLAPKTYAYDPHLDPQLVWAGKEERASLSVDTVSLHVHERIDPYTVIQAVRNQGSFVEQPSLFSKPAENPPLREAVDFYKHKHDWSNRLIAGDSLLVMNSLLEREGMAGQVQMIYMDPPYGIKYGSNFQPFTNKKTVKDNSDEDLTIEPEMIRAFRDTWELGTHSYLTHLRDRLLLSRDLLADSGSCFVQIDQANEHWVRALCSEVFGEDNFVALIPFRKKTMPLGSRVLEQMSDFIIWYAKKLDYPLKYRLLYRMQSVEGDWHYQWAESADGKVTRITEQQVNNHALLPRGVRLFMLKSLEPSGPMASGMVDFKFRGTTYRHPKNGFCTGPEGLARLEKANRLGIDGNRLAYKLYADDFPVSPLTAPWTDTIGPRDKMYVVQTSIEVVKRCMLMTSDPGDLVFDPTCGSGTTAAVAEEWGRRWITCDTSRVAVALTKQRLMTATFPYFELQREQDGVDSGFVYKTAPHITLNSLANGEPAAAETLYDRPVINRDKVRVTGPFTVEAVPAPMVSELNGEAAKPAADATMARSGPTQQQNDWRLELLKTGARGVGGTTIKFSRVEPLSGTKYLHAEAETAEGKPRRVVVSFGPEYQPLERRQVEAAWEEARNLDPRPEIVLFAAFQFDPEAAKDIDEMPAAVTKKTTFLKAQMNPDLLTLDLKKKRSNNQSFWLVGRPDVELTTISKGDDKGRFRVAVRGFDYYDIKSGEITSGDARLIAMWMLDPDYDGRSVFPRQVFFPNSGDKDGWNRLAKTLRAELDEDLFAAYFGTESLPFGVGKYRRIAVKIVDNRGIESLRVIDLP